jgi:hypothetical protein
MAPVVGVRSRVTDAAYNYPMLQTNWTAVAAVAQVAAAVATCGYLIASYFLWRAAKTAADATATQAKLTAKAVAAATTQADVARQQLELVLAQMRPVLVFLEPTLVPRHDGQYQCSCKVQNQGKSVATDVRWQVKFTAGGDTIKLIPPSRRTELQPQQWTVIDETAAPVNPTVGPPRSVNDISAHIEVQYASPLDPKVRHSVCALDFNIPSGRLSEVRYSNLPVSVTNTALSSGVPFP